MGLGVSFGGGSFSPLMPPPPPPPLMRLLPPLSLPPPPPLAHRGAFKRTFTQSTFKRPSIFPIFPICNKKPRFDKKVNKPSTPTEQIVVAETSKVGDTEKSSPQTSNEQEPKIPSELKQPLYCKLCEAKLNSPLQASAHYEGKNHGKKERMYLEKMREEKGIRWPVFRHNAKKQEKKGLEEEYCKLCSVAFTSEIQAKQHFNGRNHQRRLRGEPPLPKGFFNPLTGKWQRQPPSGVPLRVSCQNTTIPKGNKLDSEVAKACFMNAFVSGRQMKMIV